jgi:hypothetical protein
MYALAQDFRFATRQLSKSPGFTTIIILALALGIGGTTAMLIEGILLRPLPFPDADRFVLLGDHIGDSPHTPVTASRNWRLLPRNYCVLLDGRLRRCGL